MFANIYTDSIFLNEYFHFGEKIKWWIFYLKINQFKVQVLEGFPSGSDGKESASNAGFDPCVGKIPWRREQQPTPVFCPGEFHGLYSPWVHKQLETTEQLYI